MNAANVEIFCDGACSGNPGPGGWGALIRLADGETRLSGSEERTTNNRMELTALIKALEKLNSLKRADGAVLAVMTDSTYLVNAFKERWLEGWARKGWKTSAGTAVKNRDLWERLSSLLKGRSVEWRWIKAHDGHPENELCDSLARGAIKSFVRGVNIEEAGQL